LEGHALNPFTDRGGLYWFEIARIIRDNLAPSTHLRIYPPILRQPQLVTFCDFSRRRLRELVYDPAMPGHHEAETEMARVCNGSWLAGECPMRGWQRGVVRTETGGWRMREEVRGVHQLVQILLQEGVLRPSHELAMLLGSDSGEWAPRERWYT
jgi:hypothetical protein